jgi:tubulin polyglutamylase TTLL2
MSIIPGTNSGVFKTNIAKLTRGLEAHAEEFVPLTFVLPRESDAFSDTLTHSVTKQSRSSMSYWVYKPRDAWGGKDITVFGFGLEGGRKRPPPELLKRSGVIQRYIERPLLIGGYKFTLRLHLVVTQLHPVPTAFLHYDGQALFSTKPFTLDKRTLGQLRFDPLVHLTNQSANCTPSNLKNFLADKDEVNPSE